MKVCTNSSVRNTSFDRDGFVLLPNLVEGSDLAGLRDYLRRSLERGEVDSGDPLVPGAPVGYGNPVMDALLDKLSSRVELATQCQVFPTYSYFRIYRHGDRLPKHKDRPACEISVTLTIDYDADEPWPIWVETHEGSWPLEIPRGSGLLYKGAQLQHWRETFSGNWAIQVFLHYVDQNGPHKSLRFDSRSGLCLPCRSRSQHGQ